jgi:hypothetical protein
VFFFLCGLCASSAAGGKKKKKQEKNLNEKDAIIKKSKEILRLYIACDACVKIRE